MKHLFKLTFSCKNEVVVAAVRFLGLDMAVILALAPEQWELLNITVRPLHKHVSIAVGMLAVFVGREDTLYES